jgi:hypothetical protein
MADTRIQLEVEDWVRREWLATHFGQGFRADTLKLTPGGVFDFDAVSDDSTVVVNISTSGAKTARGKLGVGKLMKIRSDMLFLWLVPVERRILVLTESDMYDLCMREKENGRVPMEIEFLHAQIPDELRAKLEEAKEVASREVSPRKGK